MKKSIVLLLMLFSLTWLAAQTTGKIKGVVKDESGDPLPGAFVTVEGTTMGSQTDDNGYYYIIGVRAGTYNLKCQFVSYKTSEKKGVPVKVGLTATVDFKMVPGDELMKELTFQDTKVDKVEKGKASAERPVDMGTMETQAVADVNSALGNMGGVKKDANGQLHFRGGRAGEVNYVIDGASLSDPTGGATSVSASVNFANVESFSVQKGIPEADVGNALSGNVNIVMKIGDQKKTSGYTKYYTDAFMGDNKFDLHGGEFSLNGPIPFTDGMKMRPTYYLSTDMSTQNGFKSSYKKPGTSEYYDFGDDDLTGFGFDMPIKRSNSFNVTFKTAYDLTEKIKMSASFQKSRNIFYDYSNMLKYSPESADKNTEDVYAGTFSYKQTLSQDSYFDLVFSMYNRKLESLPMGKKPTEFIKTNELDGFILTRDDLNGNKIREGGRCEGFLDNNKNGKFDREPFLDYNGNGNLDMNVEEPFLPNYNGPVVDGNPLSPIFGKDTVTVGGVKKFFLDYNNNGIRDGQVMEPFADVNGNLNFDGDFLNDTDGDGEWDYWENGQSYNGFPSGSFSMLALDRQIFPMSFTGELLDGIYVEGYTDANTDGKYNPDIYSQLNSTYDENDMLVLDNDTDEPFYDGDSHNETGEPFVDFPRLKPNYRFMIITTFNNFKRDTKSDTTSVDRTWFWAQYDDISQFLYEVPTRTGVVKVTVDSVKTPGRFIFTYPAEPYIELPSTYGSTSQTSLRYNMSCDTAETGRGTMDEYEAYTAKKGFSSHPNTLGYKGIVNGQFVWEGSYATYRGPAPEVLLSENVNIANIVHTPQSTWQDRNGNNKYDAPNGDYDTADHFWDYNGDGRWNQVDLFANPGMVYRPAYDYRNNKVYGLKGNFTSQIDKYNMITTGFDFKYNDFEYLNALGIQTPSDQNYTNQGAYSDRGDKRTYYNYKPIEFSCFLKDKMEFEDLVLNPGVRVDMRYFGDEIKKDYDARKAASVPGYEEPFQQSIVAVSPRFGISHSISETSKLFFSYGHLYQLPNYTWIFDPNEGGSSVTTFGNMNLGYERNVQYELGVVNDLGGLVLDVTGYFKDIYDMVNTKKYKDATGELRNVYYNGDYGKSRGVELSLDRSLADHYSWSFSYTLGYAYGKSSDVSDNANMDSERDIKIREFPLDWDERHSLNTNISVVYGANEFLFDMPYLDNWSVSLNTDFGSGLPFTPTEQYYASKGIVKLKKDIERNSERLPWTSNSDLRISKSFEFVSGDGDNKISYGEIKLDFDVLNLFDKVNIKSVYANTGSWYDPGTVLGKDIDADYPDRVEYYKNPANITEKRHYKFSVSYNW